jgi:hypothetical protein
VALERSGKAVQCSALLGALYYVFKLVKSLPDERCLTFDIGAVKEAIDAHFRETIKDVH